MSLFGWFLLLVALAAIAAVAARTRRPKLPARTAPPPADDLGSLGLSAPRPASGRAPADDEASFTDEPAPVTPPRPRPSRDTVDADGVSAVRPAARHAAGATVAPDAPWAGDAAPLLIASLAAHVGGRVAVVRHDGQRHQVLARSDRGVLRPVIGSALSVDGPADLRADDLGGLSALVGSRARAVPLGGGRVLLAEGDGPDADPFAGLLAELTQPAEDAPTPAATDASGDPADEVPTAPVPRAEIIAEEQAAARDADRPLAFALVTLADAEERLTRHTPEAVAVAEADLRERLATSPDVRRVEPFGDLLFGAFLDLDAEGAGAWCGTLASSDPPLFIGAVAPADGEAGAVRDAAAQALRDAYDQQRTRVVEV